jgi:anti-sigma factor RsiW
MKCEQAEILLCDYLDGALETARRTEFESHLQSCGACAAMRRDVEAALGFMAAAAPVEVPDQLTTRILFHLPAAPKAPEKTPWWRRWFAPVLQPRLVMGMAMTILSFSMIGRLVGFEPRQLTLSDLEPARVWAAIDWKAHRTWDRAVKYYDNLRLVYDIQTRLEEWTAAEEQERRNQSRAATIDITPGTSREGSDRK